MKQNCADLNNYPRTFRYRTFLYSQLPDNMKPKQRHPKGYDYFLCRVTADGTPVAGSKVRRISARECVIHQFHFERARGNTQVLKRLKQFYRQFCAEELRDGAGPWGTSKGSL